MPRKAKEDLEALLADIRACDHCADVLPLGPRPVLQASAAARLMICSQAPGTKVHATGIPFNDPSGDRLRLWLGLDRETFYNAGKVNIIPMGFCYPGRDSRGGDLPPLPQCAERWHDRLFATLPPPKLILAIGRYAHLYHLRHRVKGSVTETVQAWREYMPQMLPLPHPSPRNTLWLKRNPWFERDVLPAVKKAVAQALQA